MESLCWGGTGRAHWPISLDNWLVRDPMSHHPSLGKDPTSKKIEWRAKSARCRPLAST